MKLSQCISGQPAKHQRSQEHAARKEARIDEGPYEIDGVVDRDKVVEREAAWVWERARDVWVRLPLQGADDHVIEGEHEHQRAKEKRDEPHPRYRFPFSLLGRFLRFDRLHSRPGHLGCRGRHGYGRSRTKRLMPEMTSTPIASRIPIAAA